MPPAALELLVLTGVRLRGFAEVDALVASLGPTAEEVRQTLLGLQERGVVLHREGRVTGWTLTPMGRDEHARLMAAELQEAGCSPEIESAYRDFLELNPRLLAAASAWQVRELNGHTVANDH